MSIESVSSEHRIFHPGQAFVDHANVSGMAAYEKLCTFANESSPAAAEKAGPPVESASPARRNGAPVRTFLLRMAAATSGTPSSWQPPPTRTARPPANLSTPLASRRLRTSSKVSSMRGRMTPTRIERGM